jgi:urease accessory protein
MAAIIMATDASRLLLLLNWMSPTFPVGGFAYSHGLEWAIEAGIVKNAASLRQWIADLITHGSGWNDAVLFSACWDAADLEELNELALSLCTSQERYFETTTLGRAFAVAASSFLLPSWGEQRRQSRQIAPVERFEQRTPEAQAQGRPKADAAQRRPDEGAVPSDGHLPSGRRPLTRLGPFGPRRPLPQGEREVAYPVAAGMACRDAGIAREDALLAWLQQFASAQVSVAVRLVPLGQSKGLEVLRDLIPIIAAAAERAAHATLDDLGSIAIGADIAAMKHETLDSRIFRT